MLPYAEVQSTDPCTMRECALPPWQGPTLRNHIRDPFSIITAYFVHALEFLTSGPAEDYVTWDRLQVPFEIGSPLHYLCILDVSLQLKT